MGADGVAFKDSAEFAQYRRYLSAFKRVRVGTRYGTLQGPMYPIVSLLPLAMNGDNLRQSSTAHVGSFRNNRLLLAASAFIAGLVLFDWEASIKRGQLSPRLYFAASAFVRHFGRGWYLEIGKKTVQ